MRSLQLEVVREYTQAFAARDVERMIALADPDIEIVTPRGTGRGHQEIRDFMRRQTYGVAMHSELVRVFHRGDMVVTEERVELRYVATGERAEAFTIAAAYGGAIEVRRRGWTIGRGARPSLSGSCV